MGWFGKRDAKDPSAVEHEIEQLDAYVQGGYTITPVALLGGLRGKAVIAGVDFSTPQTTARFLAADFRDLCHGRSVNIETVAGTSTLFFATPQAGNPGSLAHEPLSKVAPGSAALLSPTADGMESLLVLDSDELAAIGRWFETFPAGLC